MADKDKDLAPKFEVAENAKDIIARYETAGLKVTVDDRGASVVVRLAGRMTLGESTSLFRYQIRELLARPGAKKIIVDLSGVTYVDSTGLAELVSAYTVSRNAGVDLVLASLQKKVHDLMQLTKLFTVFNVYPTAEDALSAHES